VVFTGLHLFLGFSGKRRPLMLLVFLLKRVGGPFEIRVLVIPPSRRSHGVLCDPKVLHSWTPEIQIDSHHVVLGIWAQVYEEGCSLAGSYPEIVGELEVVGTTFGPWRRVRVVPHVEII
jgi:hypothetical protein